MFLGDLVDRGPNSPAVLRLVMSMVASGSALCVPGNHDIKLLKKLRGANVKISHGLAETLEQLEGESAEFLVDVAAFIDSLVSHYVLDDGRLVVAHAGLREELQGRASGRVRSFALFGETTGETDDYGLPVRYNWAGDYRGAAHVVYGHTPVPEATWTNRTICVDTGCVFGGRLTALRFPEKELVSVAAARMYYEPVRPLRPAETDGTGAALRPRDDMLDIGDVLGKRLVETRIHHAVTIREENAVAALEVMSRFAVGPQWLVYLPPTMAPSDTCRDGEYLEHPRETFEYFRREGVPSVVCQEKHMGSRAVAMVCRDAEVAGRRFGVAGDETGVVTTRTGRPFFPNSDDGREVVARIGAAMDRAGLWEQLETDWICLDAEIMPWSAKAQELLKTQYAPTGAAAVTAHASAIAALTASAARGDGSDEVLDRFRLRQECVSRFADVYRQYCWRVDRVTDLKIAPFHLLATEGRTYFDRDHVWHMNVLGELCAADPEIFRATPYRQVDIDDPSSEQAAIDWWVDLTGKGGEGMVVKPLEWIVPGRKGLVQPALKCRGREYLRLIYGPEYTLSGQMDRLRDRGIRAKRSLALREFALGVEALHRFVEREPLYRVHECVFGVLALESEPVDPRL